MKKIDFTILFLLLISFIGTSCSKRNADNVVSHDYNQKYTGEYTNRIAFPIGGMGTGMFCIEGSGAISNMSLRHRPEIFHEPTMFAALHIKGIDNATRVLEGQVPDWKKFGMPNSALGGSGTWGLPRYKENTFLARFPFTEIELEDNTMPVEVKINIWNPFVPTDADNSSLPVGGFEYEFKNTSSVDVDAIFSYNTRNFMYVHGKGTSCIKSHKNGFILYQSGTETEPFHQGEFAIFTDNPETKVDHNWFRGGWFDPLTICWNNTASGTIENNPPGLEGATGASLFVPVKLKPGESKIVRLYMAWYVPFSNQRFGGEPKTETDMPNTPLNYTYDNKGEGNYRPWYSSRFTNINEVTEYWEKNYDVLKSKSKLFSETFYNSTLPPEVIEAITSNLTILKSPTVFRQYDGRMWNWEGCGDHWGSCHGSCTHVWNYAQAVPHLFPDMERSLREVEYYVDQNKEGHQAFRSNLPIRPSVPTCPSDH